MNHIITNFIRARTIRNAVRKIDEHQLDNLPFAAVASLITRKKVMTDFNNFNKLLFKKCNISWLPPIKNYMSLYIMIAEDENDDNKGCIEFAKEIIKWKNIIKFMGEHDRYDNVMANHYVKAVYNFLYEFESWKRIDLEKMIGALCMSYYEILNMKNQITNNQESNKNAESEENSGGEESGGSPSSGGSSSSGIEDGGNTQQDIENKMYQEIMFMEFDKQLKDIKNGLSKLTPDSEKHLKEFGKHIQSVAVSDEITEIMERAYWDKLKEEINETPSNFKTVLSMFDEIGSMLCELTPSREDAKAEISRVLDSDYIQYMVDQNTFNREELSRIFLFILRKIQSYESPVRNVETKFMITEFTQRIEDNSDLLGDVIAVTFKNVYEKISQIYEDMVNAVNMFDK